MRKSLCVIGFCVTTLLAAGCSDEQQQQAMETAGDLANKGMAAASEGVDMVDDQVKQALAQDTAAGESATAVVKPVADSGVSGKVVFTDIGEQTQVYAQASGLQPGVHAFHVHQNGDCSNNAKAAGPHAAFPNDDAGDIHGNLGEFQADAGGTDRELAVIDAPLSFLNGKSVVFHAKGNDPSQPPAGAAGGRIACGVIQ